MTALPLAPGDSATAPTIAVRAIGVEKHYGAVKVLHGVDLAVPAGTCTCIIGPSGSGKSTILRCINHMESISAGRIWVNGHLVGYVDKGDYLQEMSDIFRGFIVVNF